MANATENESTVMVNNKQLDLSWEMFSNIPGLIWYHVKENNFNYAAVIYFIFVHTTAFMGLCRLHLCSYETLLFAWALWPITGMAVTVGAHRLWAHRTYEAHFLFRLWLAFTNSIAYQGSIYTWCVNHRIHHQYAETDADPHNSCRGFFYSHFGWLVLRKHPDRIEAQKKLDVSDLLEDPIVRFQHMFDPFYPFYFVFYLPGQIAHYGWGEDFWTAVLVAGSFRYCCVLHFTFLVNSAAHLWGDRPYDPKSVAADHPWVAAITGGEGWHNWHHKYPFDYACSEYGITSQFNPSKLYIDIAAALGLAWGRKRGTSAWAMTRERRHRESKENEATNESKTSVPLAKKVM